MTMNTKNNSEKANPLDMDSYSTILNSGSHWSLVIRKGIQLKITDMKGGANVGMIFYNPTMPSEKYNAPDTLKCQHTFKLTRGNCLYSEMGRVFCSITEDSFGWHESVCGNSHASHVEARWGKRDYQNQRNRWLQNGYDSFLVELAKYGLTERDMASNINIFSKVSSDETGNLALTGRSKQNDSVTLRFEMDTLVIMHTCPHPLNTDEHYPNSPVKFELSRSAPVKEDDFCMNFRPENRRGFMNNALYHFGS